MIEQLNYKYGILPDKVRRSILYNPSCKPTQSIRFSTHDICLSIFLIFVVAILLLIAFFLPPRICILPFILERYRTIVSSFYRGAHGIILTFDVTDINSFLKVRRKQYSLLSSPLPLRRHSRDDIFVSFQLLLIVRFEIAPFLIPSVGPICIDWLSEIKKNAPEGTRVLLVGNKSDMQSKRMVDSKEVFHCPFGYIITIRILLLLPVYWYRYSKFFVFNISIYDLGSIIC